MVRSFKNNVSNFLRKGRGWFPSNLPKNLTKMLLKQCPDTGTMKIAKQGLRIMSYNVLATTLTDEFEYGMDPDYIKWENRFPAI